MPSFVIQQYTGHQYEPIPEGEYDSAEAAITGMREMEKLLGWRAMRVVKVDDEPRTDLSGSPLTGDNAHEVLEYGLGNDDNAED